MIEHFAHAFDAVEYLQFKLEKHPVFTPHHEELLKLVIESKMALSRALDVLERK